MVKGKDNLGGWHTCKICIFKKGLKGSELATCGYAFRTEEELFGHMEEYHGYIIQRKGETKKQASDRVHKKFKDYGKDGCACGKCREERKELEKEVKTNG